MGAPSFSGEVGGRHLTATNTLSAFSRFSQFGGGGGGDVNLISRGRRLWLLTQYEFIFQISILGGGGGGHT